jgi:large subunit ribosomal protein L20
MKVKHSVASKKKKKKVLEAAKGYWGERSKKFRRATETVKRALVYAYRDRRNKKREFRSLWIERINAAVRMRGMSYRAFIHKLKEKQILLSRDILAKIASEEPQVFDKIVEEVNK